MESRIGSIKEDLKKLKELLSKVDTQNLYYNNTSNIINESITNIDRYEIKATDSSYNINSEMNVNEDKNSIINMVKNKK